MPDESNAFGQEIEQTYQQSFDGEFPYEDCFRLTQIIGSSPENLIPDLDLYFSTIAGYSSSASRLHNRSISELQTARMLLSVDAYERFPRLERYRSFITQENTPHLLNLMRVAEHLRKRLLMLLDDD